jgi:copper homeostasis protein
VAKELGADGVVFGILLPDGTIDAERMKVLVDIARPMGITCHRAFDMTADPIQAMDDLIKLGIDRILTSGQQPTAPEGATLIRELISKSAGRILIMPGSGVKEHNVSALIKATGASEVHIHLDKQEHSGMTFKRSSVKMGTPGQSEYEYTMTSRERIIELRLSNEQ